MKTFLICPGAERSGTSWLHSYLKLNKNINFGDLKEYHYLDSVNLKEFSGYRNNNMKHDIFYKFYENEFEYYNYFIDILNACDITGDFSPGYSGLSEDIFAKTINTFKNLGVETKAIYLVRDPVKRHISATNLRIKYDHLSLSSDEYNQMILFNIDDPIFNINGDYRRSHEKMLNVFKDNYLIKKYENLFNEKSIQEVCNFLNIEYLTPNFEIKINEKPVFNLEIYESTIDQLYFYYQKEIEFIKTIDV